MTVVISGLILEINSITKVILRKGREIKCTGSLVRYLRSVGIDMGRYTCTFKNYIYKGK